MDLHLVHQTLTDIDDSITRALEYYLDVQDEDEGEEEDPNDDEEEEEKLIKQIKKKSEKKSDQCIKKEDDGKDGKHEGKQTDEKKPECKQQ